jgi:rSAM/selenodomain-associated transferase 1
MLGITKKNKMTNITLQMFAKHPTPGKVKTRLTTCMSAERAAEVHISLLYECLDKLMRLPSYYKIELWGDEAETKPFFAQLLEKYPRVSFRLQRGADLGLRMAFAMRTGLDQCAKVILIGSDCPVLQVSDILNVEQSLKPKQLDLIGAEDGGYVLIGCCSYSEQLFINKNWGTSQVLTQTVETAKLLGWGCIVHCCFWDVDVAEDYQRYLALKSESA